MVSPSVWWTFVSLSLRCSIMNLFPTSEGVICWHANEKIFDQIRLSGSGDLEPTGTIVDSSKDHSGRCLRVVPDITGVPLVVWICSLNLAESVNPPRENVPWEIRQKIHLSQSSLATLIPAVGLLGSILSIWESGFLPPFSWKEFSEFTQSEG